MLLAPGPRWGASFNIVDVGGLWPTTGSGFATPVSTQNAPHVHEHFTLCVVLEFLGCFDQLTVPRLLGAEVLCRRL